MSTIGRLRELVAGKVLEEWSSPLQHVAIRKRRFWVVDDVKKELELDPWPPALAEGQRSAQDRRIRTHALINLYVEGKNLTIATGKNDADLKCLKPMERVPDWRVWSFRPWRDMRLTRILGEFAGPDDFVALKVIPRTLLRNWNIEAGHVDAAWMNLFPGEEPLHWDRPPSPGAIGRNYSYV